MGLLAIYANKYLGIWLQPTVSPGSTRLTSLMVPNNPRLSHIPESLWTALERVDISSCNFSRLPQNDAPYLTELIAANNPELKKISEAVWHRLHELNISSCGFTKNPDIEASQLTSLRISNNALKEFPKTRMPALQYLIANSCGFKKIPKNFSLSDKRTHGFRNYLSLRNNKLVTLPDSLITNHRWNWGLDVTQNSLSQETVMLLSSLGKDTLDRALYYDKSVSPKQREKTGN